MGYYIRVLTPSRKIPSLATIQRGLEATGVGFQLSYDGEPDAWREVELKLKAGDPLCNIERNDVGDSGLWREEIDEFLDEISDAEPASAAAWLAAYLPAVQTIYAIQIFGGTEKPGGWDLVSAAKDTIWSVAGGIFQADNEGFSNEDGYHILWQFNETVAGGWWMAVLEDGRWVRFQMELGDTAHRAAFKQGRAPPGVETQAG